LNSTLKGEGFKRIAEEGQTVKAGDTVIEFDLALLEEKFFVFVSNLR